MPFLKSVVFSLLASLIATYLLRRLLSAEGGSAEAVGPGRKSVSTVVVVIPVLVGNSGNRLIQIQTSPFSFLGWQRRR